MSLKIPLNLAGQPPTQETGDKSIRLRLPVSLSGVLAGGVRSTSSTSRQGQALRAVAAATALYDPAGSLELVKLAKNTPEDVIAPSLNLDRLNVVLNAIGRVQDQPGNAPKVDKGEIAAAAATGAQAAHVAAALQAIKGGRNKAERDALAEETRNWVAAVDPTLLEKAARAGAMTLQLERVPTPTSRLDRVEASIGKLDERVEKLEKKVFP